MLTVVARIGDQKEKPLRAAEAGSLAHLGIRKPSIFIC